MKLKYFEQIHRFNDILSEVGSLYHEIARRQGLSDSSMDILYCVAQLGDGCPVSQVYKRNGGSRQTVSSALRKLEQEGVLYLQASGGTRKNICLTERGHRLLEEKILPILRMENEIFLSWEEGEVAEYLRLDQKYLDDLRSKVKSTFVGD